MIRALVIALFVLFAAPAPLDADEAAQSTAGAVGGMCVIGAVIGVELSAPLQSEECCKICRKGKACGDTCIARDKVCRKAPGCACDA